MAAVPTLAKPPLLSTAQRADSMACSELGHNVGSTNQLGCTFWLHRVSLPFMQRMKHQLVIRSWRDERVLEMSKVEFKQETERGLHGKGILIQIGDDYGWEKFLCMYVSMYLIYKDTKYTFSAGFRFWIQGQNRIRILIKKYFLK
jgi:hypothetical protein